MHTIKRLGRRARVWTAATAVAGGLAASFGFTAASAAPVTSNLTAASAARVTSAAGNDGSFTFALVPSPGPFGLTWSSPGPGVPGLPHPQGIACLLNPATGAGPGRLAGRTVPAWRDRPATGLHRQPIPATLTTWPPARVQETGRRSGAHGSIVTGTPSQMTSPGQVLPGR
jgi:hypothetical protein